MGSEVMDNKEELVEKLISIFEDMIHDLYLVTDGKNVSSVVFNKNTANYMCKRMTEATKRQWVVCKGVDHAINYAFEHGYSTIFREMIANRQNEKSETKQGCSGDCKCSDDKDQRDKNTEEEGDLLNEEAKELRICNVQQEAGSS